MIENENQQRTYQIEQFKMEGKGGEERKREREREREREHEQ